MAKSNDINKMIKRYEQIFAETDENTREVARGLYEELAYMKHSLVECKEKTLKEGIVIKDKSGNGFEIMKEHPAQKLYNTIIGNYTRTVKLLKEIIPQNDPVSDAFEEMLKEDKELM